jgi:ATP-dependent 26S proteasome regulatory subunit
MAQAKFITALIRAHLGGDHNAFRRVAMQIAAKESSLGHNVLAKEIKDAFDNSMPNFGQYGLEKNTNKQITDYNLNTNASALLHASYCKEQLRDMVLAEQTSTSIENILAEWKSQSLLETHGLTKKNKVLLVGPPGCGKTMTAKVFSGELGLPLYVVKIESLISRYLGETSVHLKNIFNSMAVNSGVYLFDEFDSIGTTRSDMRDVGEVRRVLSTFLLLLEGFTGNSLIVAATNYDKILDVALFRRFDDVIQFPMPEQNDIDSLLRLRLSAFPKKEIKINVLAEEAIGMNYAEISKAVIDAIKTSILRNHNKLTQAILIEAIKYRKNMTPPMAFV